MTEPKWKVGDPVVIEKPGYSHHGKPTVEHATVDRVARKYFYVGQVKGRWDEVGYEIATGTEKPDSSGYSNYLGHAYTPLEWEDKQQRDRLFEKIREHGNRGTGLIDISWSWGNREKWSTNRLRDLVVLLECVAADQPRE